MRKPHRFLFCLLALLTMLTVFAGANSLPPSSIYVSIDGPDDGITHVALLGREPSSESSPNLPAALTAALPDGWLVCDCVPYGETGQQVFLWISPFPSPFRAALLYEDGTLLVTSDAERTRAMQTFTVDTQTGEITTLPIWIGLLLQFACTCSVTLVVEAVVLLLFRFSFRENWKLFLLVNLATQLIMTLTFGRELVNAGGYSAVIMAFLAEFVIFIVETIVYALFLRGHTRARRVLYALAANLASFFIGFFGIMPVYTYISTLI